jgi:hypothetical protein
MNFVRTSESSISVATPFDHDCNCPALDNDQVPMQTLKVEGVLEDNSISIFAAGCIVSAD